VGSFTTSSTSPVIEIFASSSLATFQKYAITQHDNMTNAFRAAEIRARAWRKLFQWLGPTHFLNGNRFNSFK
jgi:hypothetical protein